MIKPIKAVVEEVSIELEQIYEQAEAKNITMLLLEDKYQIDRSDLLANATVELDQALLEADIQRLLNHEPIQYVTGTAYFYGRKFHIRKGALVPRPETEELVHLIVTENEVMKPKILDIGSGSGCIAISLEQELNGETCGIDSSREALEISLENAASLKSGVTFLHCDVLEDDPTIDHLDILVSNPPYIPNEERKVMRKNVLNFEPQGALFVPDSDPLLFYQRIAELGLILLKSGGKLYFEIHENFGEEIISMTQNLGYRQVQIHKDMQGKDRILSATNSTSKSP